MVAQQTQQVSDDIESKAMVPKNSEQAQIIEAESSPAHRTENTASAVGDIPDTQANDEDLQIFVQSDEDKFTTIAEIATPSRGRRSKAKI